MDKMTSAITVNKLGENFVEVTNRSQNYIEAVGTIYVGGKFSPTVELSPKSVIRFSFVGKVKLKADRWKKKFDKMDIK